MSKGALQGHTETPTAESWPCMRAKNLCRAKSSHKKQNTHPIDIAVPKLDGKGVSNNQPPNHYLTADWVAGTIIPAWNTTTWLKQNHSSKIWTPITVNTTSAAATSSRPDVGHGQSTEGEQVLWQELDQYLFGIWAPRPAVDIMDNLTAQADTLQQALDLAARKSRSQYQ